MRIRRFTPVSRSTAIRWLFVLALALIYPLVSTQEGRVQDASPTGQPDGGAWVTVGGSSARTGEASGSGPQQNPAVFWHFVPAFTEWDQLAVSTIVSDRMVFVAGGFGQPMYALDQMTGEVHWSADVGWASTANDSTAFFTASADQGTLYVAGTEGVAQCDCNPPAALYALDTRSGEERWRRSIPDLTNLSVPAVAGDLIILTAQWDEDSVLAFDAATGEERWRVPLGPDVGNGASVAVADATVYIAPIRFRRGGLLLALDAGSGVERWRVETEGYPRLAPVVTGEAIFLVTDTEDMSGTSLVAFDRSGGAELWSAGLSDSGAATVQLSAWNGLVYAGYSDFGADGMPASQMVAFTAASGAERWRKDGMASSVAAAGILYASAVDTGSGELTGTIFALDAVTGAELWRLDGPYGVTTVAGGMLFAVGMHDVWAIAEWTGSGPPETREVSGPAIEPTIPPSGDGAASAEVPSPTISVVSPDGTDLIVLGEGNDPQWSPDGSTLAYEAFVGDETDIWVVGADGSNAHLVVEVAGLDTHPTWSPDGTRIAFVNGNGGILYVVNTDGSGLVELATVSGGGPQGDPFFQRPSWSPDGAKIAFAAADRGSVGISTINVDGSGLTRLTVPEVVAAPVGSETFETVVIGVMCMAPDLMENPPSELVPNGDPVTYEAGGCRRADPGEMSFSVVGSRHANTGPWTLASADTDENGEAHLRGNLLEGEEGFYTLRMVGPMQGGTMVGSHDIELPFASTYLFVYLTPPSLGMEPVDEGPPPPDGMGEIPEAPVAPPMTDDELFGPSSEIISTAPVWSPDGTRIAYTVLEPGDDGGISGGGIWLMNADGSGKVQITDVVPDETAAIWSPDGAQLLFASGWTATQIPDIYLARVDGSGVIQVTDTADTPEANPAWSPDGLRIVFSAYSETGWDLVISNTDRTGVTPIVPGEGDTFAPDWSPDGSRIAFTSRPAFQGGGD